MDALSEQESDRSAPDQRPPAADDAKNRAGSATSGSDALDGGEAFPSWDEFLAATETSWGADTGNNRRAKLQRDLETKNAHHYLAAVWRDERDRIARWLAVLEREERDVLRLLSGDLTSAEAVTEIGLRPSIIRHGLP